MPGEAIAAARAAFARCQFDEQGCDLGLRRLRAYRKEWDEGRGVWKARPRHDDASHGADAFLTFAYSNYAPPSALLDCAVGAQVAGDVELHRGFGDVDCRPP